MDQLAVGRGYDGGLGQWRVGCSGYDSCILLLVFSSAVLLVVVVVVVVVVLVGVTGGEAIPQNESDG